MRAEHFPEFEVVALGDQPGIHRPEQRLEPVRIFELDVSAAGGLAQLVGKWLHAREFARKHAGWMHALQLERDVIRTGRDDIQPVGARSECAHDRSVRGRMHAEKRERIAVGARYDSCDPPRL